MISLDVSKLPDRLHVGTSSFSSADWVDLFYPSGLKPGDYLRFYGSQLRTVEIDATWYSIPSTRTVDGWAKKVPEGFLFAAKVPKLITHELHLEGCEREWSEFLRRMDRLGEKKGPLLFQFPYVAKRRDPEEYETGNDFRERLARFLPHIPDEGRFVVEVRNRSWLGEPLYDLLRSRKISLALADYYTMPRSSDYFRDGDPLTADFGYVRFLGHHRVMDNLVKEAKSEGRIDRDWGMLLVDRSRETRSWISVIRNMLKTESDVFAYFNNHYAGFGPGSIDLFLKIWDEE